MYIQMLQLKIYDVKRSTMYVYGSTSNYGMYIYTLHFKYETETFNYDIQYRKSRSIPWKETQWFSTGSITFL